MTSCTECFRVIVEGDLRANYPTGVLCLECGDTYHKKHLKGMRVADVMAHFARQKQLGKSDTVTVGNHDVPRDLLTDYADKVSFTRRAGIYHIGTEDPIIVMKALKAREEAHIRILDHVGVQYLDPEKPTHDEKSVKFSNALSGWLESLEEMKE